MVLEYVGWGRGKGLTDLHHNVVSTRACGGAIEKDHCFQIQRFDPMYSSLHLFFFCSPRSFAVHHPRQHTGVSIKGCLEVFPQSFRVSECNSLRSKLLSCDGLCEGTTKTSRSALPKKNKQNQHPRAVSSSTAEPSESALFNLRSRSNTAVFQPGHCCGSSPRHTQVAETHAFM